MGSRRGWLAFRATTLGVTASMAVLFGVTAAAQAKGRCGDHRWCNTRLSPNARAGLLLKALTRAEKISLLAGDDLTVGFGPGADGHTGTSDGVERVDLPPTFYNDGPAGARQAGGRATAMPAPLGLAAAFSPRWARRYGAVVGNEAKLKGNDVVFAPTVNIMRTPLGGRTFEGYGEDPFLVSRTAVGWIRGTQSEGVIANVKHFAANNQEGQGVTPPVDIPGAPNLGVGVFGNRFTVSAVVDERTLREIYLPAFEAAVRQANVGSVMCSYNRLNGQWACENQRLLNEILKREWGFKGFVLTDYGAGRNTANGLNNGLDFEPWPGLTYSPLAVNAALGASQASPADVDEHVRRILRTLFAYGFFDRRAHPNDDDLIDKRRHARIAGKVEEQAITLLKNDGILPLKPARVKSIALIGESADSFRTGGGSSEIEPFFVTTPRQGIERRAGRKLEVHYDPGDNADRAAALARDADVAIVFAADASAEGADKRCLGIDCGGSGDQDALIERVAEANPKTVVVLVTGGPVLTPWRGEVAGLLEAWYPGSRGGTAIARVLFGDVDPGGRLPASFPRREEHLPTTGDPEAYPGIAETVHYKEGVLVGYRWLDAERIKPAFPFGHGLSYTSFRFRGLRLRPADQDRGARGSGGALAKVSVAVTNTGRRPGFAVPQLYVGMPQPGPGIVQPPRQLKGFEKVRVRPGETKRVSLRLGRRDLSFWDVDRERWRVASGCYRIMVGHSSRRLPLRGELAHSASCGRRAVRIR